MKQFSIIINDKVIEVSADRFYVSDGELTLYVGSEIVAFFARGASIMETKD